MIRKMCLILVTYTVFSKSDDAFFMVKKHQKEEYFCITNSSSAMAWISDDSEQGLYQESEFLPSHTPKHRGLVCNKNEKFKYECTMFREVVLDRRWEEFPIIKSSELNFTTVANISDPDFDIAFSARVSHNSDVFLCDATSTNCYWFLLQTNVTAIRKCVPNCGTNLHETQHFLDSKVWNHFVITKTGNNLSLSQINNGNSQTVVQINDSDVFSLNKMVVRSDKTSFWKIHEVEASKLSRSTLNLNVYTFMVENGSLCVSMFIKSCPFCRFQFELRGNGFRNGVLNRQIFEPQAEWHEIKITAQNITYNNATLWLSTLTSTSQKGQFWLYSSVRYCYGSELRMISLNQKANCQLVSTDDKIEILEDRSQNLNNTCPEGAVSEYCIPCWWFTKQNDCDQLTICQNGECSHIETESDSFEYRYLIFLLLLLVVPAVAAILIKKRSGSKNKHKIHKTPEDGIPLEDMTRYVASPSRNKNQNYGSVNSLKSPAKTKPIQVNDFPNYVQALVQNDTIMAEFLEIVDESSPKSIPKNLILDYIDIFYLSGHHIPKVYIATLVPQPNQFDDFWKLVWDESVENIALLDNSAAQFEVHSKNYWPSMNEIVQYGDIIVYCSTESIHQHYEHRKFILTYGNQSRLVEQLRFCSCTDYDTPLAFVPLFQKMSKISSKSPILVHCSLGTAGAGFAVLCDMTLRISEKDGAVDIFGNARRMSSLLNGEYYKLAHLVILESLLVARKDSDVYSNLNCDENFENCANYLNQTLWIDEAMEGTEKESNEYFRAARNDYVGEVFFQSFTPNEEVYSLLETLKGSFINGFKCPNKYLMTKYPSSQNLETFWKMCIKVQISIMVSFNLDCNQISEIEFPTGLKLKFGNLKNFGKYDCVTVHLLHDELKIHKTVEMFAIPEWPLRAPDFAQLCIELHSTTKNTTPVLVTCPDGVSASGMYVAMNNVISQSREENTRELCASIRAIRRHCREFCKEEDELRFLWEASKCHWDECQLYELCH